MRFIYHLKGVGQSVRCSDPSYIKKIMNRCSKQKSAFPQQLIGYDNHAHWAASNSRTCCLAMPARSGSKGHPPSISLVTRKLYNQRSDVHVLNTQINKRKPTKIMTGKRRPEWTHSQLEKFY